MLKKVSTMLFCFILNLVHAEETKTQLVISSQPPVAQVEKEQNLLPETKKESVEGESEVTKNSENVSSLQYADKNLSNALEQLRNEKDQLQTEFEKLLEQQAKTNGLINENKQLKSDLAALQKFKKELNQNVESNTQLIDEKNKLSDALEQSIKKINELLIENDRLTAKISEYETRTMRHYSVRLGDTLPKIAKRECQNKVTWEELYSLNSAVIKNPDVLFVGMMLTLSAECI